LGFAANAALKRAKIGRITATDDTWWKGAPAASSFFFSLFPYFSHFSKKFAGYRTKVEGRRTSTESFTSLLSSCDRYRPRDKRRITGIKQLPRRTATAIPVSVMYHCTRIFPIASFLDPIQRICGVGTCVTQSMGYAVERVRGIRWDRANTETWKYDQNLRKKSKSGKRMNWLECFESELNFREISILYT